MSLRERDQSQTETSPGSRPFMCFPGIRDLFSSVSRTPRLPQRANEPRPRKLTRETCYRISSVEELPRVRNLKPEDIIIAVMGPTGTGKSTFIQKAMDRSWGVGHSLQSPTSKVRAVRILFSNGTSLVLVDTPGFGDTNKSDLDILKTIAKWFKDVYEHKLGISGVLYLHRITDNRMGRTSQKNLKLLKKLCGEDYFHLVFPMTTMWPESEETDEDVFLNRESQLQKGYWADIIRNPAQIQRFRGTRASAWKILEEITGITTAQQQRKMLAIQRELVDLSKRLPDTSAGQQLRDWFEESAREQALWMRNLQDDLDTTTDPDVSRALMEVERQKRQTEKLLRRMDG